MNRQRAAHFRITRLHIQQGLWAIVALLITLLAVQQLLLWHESQQPEAPLISTQRAPQTHFSAVSNLTQESASMRMMEVDQAQPLTDLPREERWVF